MGRLVYGRLFSLKATGDKAREQSLEPREVGASANLGAAADVKTSVLETSADQVSETGSTSEGGK